VTDFSPHVPGPSVSTEIGRETHDFLKDVGELVHDTVEELKPRFRGWLHASVVPVALVSLLAVLAMAEEPRARIGAVVFLTAAVVMFTTSALFHTRSWSEAAFIRWQRLDHANIFVLIAGSCTPFALLILDGPDAMRLLTLVWGGAIAGVLFKVLWISAPRGLSVCLYVLLGCTALLYAPDFVSAGSPEVIFLAAFGGVSYVIGALVYAFRRPNPLPTTFGYHEVFHALTVTGFAAHGAGVGLLLLG
jgi:hemolysin III